MDESDSARTTEQQPNVAGTTEGRGPLLATLIASAVVLLVLAHGGEAISDDIGERLAFALGLAAAPAIIVGAVTFIVALRKAPLRWKIGSPATILLVAIFAGFVQASGWLA